MDPMMNRLQPIRFYIALLAFFLAALVAGFFFFLIGISESTYLVSNGVEVSTHFIDKPRYDFHLQGLIFAISFLVAGLLLTLLIVLPDDARAMVSGYMAPQPVPAPAPALAEPPARAPAPPPEPGPEPDFGMQEERPMGQSPPLTIEEAEGEPEGELPSSADPASAAPQGSSLEKELDSSRTNDLPELDMSNVRMDEGEEEDVVYGDGRISEDAAWEFLQQYPDSAVKFLYRRNLDNKPLSPTDEDIYRIWESRGLSRGKIREILLEIMGWPSLPDAFPHQIWKELRDQIFEIQRHKH